ncbi:cytidylyltransferase [Bacteriovorax sp. Seq25_V]|uniref:cytidylyltransferase n=1 Tax=Bacteriovorax sp. Seq25_V TaxID=1201288 RepID=UPI000389EB1B|nr:cytidylyltransferase [Bacteriovorax sp. Seq25_V]EQC43834.1 cytidylyltransferase [Bacteriovorax sp. Seq25_V]
MAKYQLTKYSNGYVLARFDGEVCGEKIFDNDYVILTKSSATEVSAVEFEYLDFDIEESVQMEILKAIGLCFRFMPNFIGHEDFIPNLFMPKVIDDNFDLTFFGGSFNPWHPGHSECIKQCAQFENAIVVVPDYSPWKDNLMESPLREMIKISKKVRGASANAAVYPGFWGSSQRNPTSKWIKDVQESKKNWLMGEDTFDTLLSWFEVDTFLDEIEKIYILPRSFERRSSSSVAEVEKYIVDKHPSLDVIWLKDHPFKDLASSKIR